MIIYTVRLYFFKVPQKVTPSPRSFMTTNPDDAIAKYKEFAEVLAASELQGEVLPMFFPADSLPKLWQREWDKLQEDKQ